MATVRWVQPVNEKSTKVGAHASQLSVSTDASHLGYFTLAVAICVPLSACPSPQ